MREWATTRWVLRALNSSSPSRLRVKVLTFSAYFLRVERGKKTFSTPVYARICSTHNDCVELRFPKYSREGGEIVQNPNRRRTCMFIIDDTVIRCTRVRLVRSFNNRTNVTDTYTCFQGFEGRTPTHFILGLGAI